MRHLLLLVLTLQLSYYTGQRVFKSRFPPEVIENSRDTYIKVNNSSTDIIVAVENVYAKKVIRHAYIKKNDSYTFYGLPTGTYVCKYMWTDSDGRKRYEKDDQTMTYKSDETGGYEITLLKSVDGNLSQSKISENEFFN